MLRPPVVFLNLSHTIEGSVCFFGFLPREDAMCHKILVVGLLFTNHLAFGRLEKVSYTHHAGDTPSVWGYMDIHRGKSIKDEDAKRILYAEETHQCECILADFQAYREPEPLHFFIEAGILTENLPYLSARQKLFMPLYKGLKTLTNGTQHRVEDFDIRNILAVATIFFNHNGPLITTSNSIVALPTFTDLWSEIDRYLTELREACLSHFGADKFEHTQARTMLDDIEFMYNEIKSWLQTNAIDSTSSLAESADLLSSSGRQELRRLIGSYLLVIGELTDIALFLRVIDAHKAGKRVIVYAGGEHIRSLRTLLIDEGFCNAPLDCFSSVLNKRDLKRCFDKDDHWCGYSTCLIPPCARHAEESNQCVVS